MRQKSIETTCAFCGGIFLVTPSKKALGFGIFCSRKCYNTKHKKIEMHCASCQKQFLIYPSEVEKGKKRNNKYGHFCSLSCKSKVVSLNRILRPLADRFLERITMPDDLHDCWVYKDIHKRSGYGRLRFKNTYILAHRFSYQYHNKTEVPDNVMVCHTCDNPSCVNPFHLWLGSGLDNTRDKIKKGRAGNLKGSKHQNSKLTEDQVKEIKIKLSHKTFQSQIAKEYGVSQTVICNINTGKTWGHV